MPRPAACLRAAEAKAVLNTVTLGMPRRSISTASATLIEVEVPQSPKQCTTASHCAKFAKSPSVNRILGRGLADDRTMDRREAIGKLRRQPLDEEVGVALAVVDKAEALAANVG